MLLLTRRIKTTERTERTVVFNSAVDLFGKRIGNFDVGRKLEAAFGAWTFEGALEGWIESEIPTLELFVDDRPNLPTPRVRGEFAPHIANLLRQTYTNGPVPLRRNAKAGANVCADEIQTTAIAGAGENIEAGFKPVVKAVRDLNG